MPTGHQATLCLFSSSGHRVEKIRWKKKSNICVSRKGQFNKAKGKTEHESKGKQRIYSLLLINRQSPATSGKKNFSMCSNILVVLMTTEEISVPGEKMVTWKFTASNLVTLLWLNTNIDFMLQTFAPEQEHQKCPTSLKVVMNQNFHTEKILMTMKAVLNMQVKEMHY